MVRNYRQFSLEERCEITRLQAQGCSLRQIAAALDRSPSSISRELKRNTGSKVGYRPAFAAEQAKARRWKGSKLDRKPELRAAVLQALAQRCSPEQVAGRMAREAGRRLISHETIYRFIQAQITRHNDVSWRHYLPRGKSKRGVPGRKGGSSASFIQDRVSIAQRPAEAELRHIPGHWEADTMLFSIYGQSVLALHERSSRLLIGQRPPNRTAPLIADTIHAIMAALPPALRKTITFDNGTEFAHHWKLQGIQIGTFFCNTHSPWQKASIENAIGRLRRFLPRKTNLASLTEQEFNQLIAAYNNTPRKCLDYRTPAEVFCQQLLHFKCESTSRLSPG
jgi:IS30 family transposase